MILVIRTNSDSDPLDSQHLRIALCEALEVVDAADEHPVDGLRPLLAARAREEGVLPLVDDLLAVHGACASTLAPEVFVDLPSEHVAQQRRRPLRLVVALGDTPVEKPQLLLPNLKGIGGAL